MTPFILALRSHPRRHHASPHRLLPEQRLRRFSFSPIEQQSCTTINFHDFSVFLREQPQLRDYFRVVLRFPVSPSQSSAW